MRWEGCRVRTSGWPHCLATACYTAHSTTILFSSPPPSRLIYLLTPADPAYISYLLLGRNIYILISAHTNTHLHSLPYAPTSTATACHLLPLCTPGTNARAGCCRQPTLRPSLLSLTRIVRDLPSPVFPLPATCHRDITTRIYYLYAIAHLRVTVRVYCWPGFYTLPLNMIPAPRAAARLENACLLPLNDYIP